MNLLGIKYFIDIIFCVNVIKTNNFKPNRRDVK